MGARQALHATYAYLCGLLGEEKVESLLDGEDAVTASARARGVPVGAEALAGLRIVKPA